MHFYSIYRPGFIKWLFSLKFLITCQLFLCICTYVHSGVWRFMVYIHLCTCMGRGICMCETVSASIFAVVRVREGWSLKYGVFASLHLIFNSGHLTDSKVGYLSLTDCQWVLECWGCTLPHPVFYMGPFGSSELPGVLMLQMHTATHSFLHGYWGLDFWS